MELDNALILTPISTHALREEGDLQTSGGWATIRTNFYPRPPRGGRPGSLLGSRAHRPFLPTPSARRATYFHSVRMTQNNAISTHALREEGDRGLGVPIDLLHISTHALREEGDAASVRGRQHHGQFLPTPSARRATAESRRPLVAGRHFYPRPPRGGRRQGRRGRSRGVRRFLPTPSARRATDGLFYFGYVRRDFYPRPPRGGRRVRRQRWLVLLCNFYPRPPRGGRLLSCTKMSAG